MSLYNERFLNHEHPSVAYLKRDDIGLVLSKGLSEAFKAQPSKPIEFFAKFLLNHSKTQKKAQAEREREKVVKELKDKNAYFLKAKQAEHEEQAKLDKEKSSKISKFYTMLEKSEDLSDNLDELAVYLKEFTNATGVYIGKLVKPRKDINDDDDDKAHIDDENPKVVSFIHSSEGHEFIKGQILKHNQGVTHGVFNPPVVQEENQQQYEDEENRPPVQVVKSDDVLETQHHVYVKEVVRERMMHFYRVPKLGSFLAVPLVYNSCLFEDALDNAVADYFAVQKAREDQEKAKADYEDDIYKLRDEKEKLGEVFEMPEPKEWPEINQKPFDTFQEQYVVCIDTMGQDRELTEEERRFAIQTVINFKDIWERTEFENLTRDRNRKIQNMEFDKDFLDNESQKLLDEEEKHVEEQLLQHLAQSAEGSAPIDEEVKDLMVKQTRLHFIAKLFKERDDWRKNLFSIRQFKVLKMPRVLQSIFYFLQYAREDICEKGTNKFFWKRAKSYLNIEFVKKLFNYNALGPKEAYQQRYTTINFIEKNIEGINPEEVDAYHLTLGKLYRWLLLAIKTRKEDITRRKALKKRAREHRDDLIEHAKKREEKYVNDLRDAQAKFLEDHKDEIESFNRYQQELSERGADYQEEEGEDATQKTIPNLPAFNEADWQLQWLAENPEIVIPDQVTEEKDNDWYMNQEDEDMLIAQYFQQKEGPGGIPGAGTQPPK